MDAPFRGTPTCTIGEAGKIDRIENSVNSGNELLYLKNPPDTLKVVQQLQADSDISSHFSGTSQTIVSEFKVNVRNELANANFISRNSYLHEKKN